MNAVKKSLKTIIALILLTSVPALAEQYRVINNGFITGTTHMKRLLTPEERAARIRQLLQNGDFESITPRMGTSDLKSRVMSLEAFSETFIPSLLGSPLSPESEALVLKDFPEAEGISFYEAFLRLRLTPEWQAKMNPEAPQKVEGFISSITGDSNSFETANCSEPHTSTSKINSGANNRGEHNYQNLLRLYSALENRGDPTLGGYMIDYSDDQFFSPLSLMHPEISSDQIENYKGQVRDSLAHLRSVCGLEVAGVSTAGPDDGFRAGNSTITQDGIILAQ